MLFLSLFYYFILCKILSYVAQMYVVFKKYNFILCKNILTKQFCVAQMYIVFKNCIFILKVLLTKSLYGNNVYCINVFLFYFMYSL